MDDEIIKFDQLNINLNNVNTNTIKGLKIQETSTMKLINCLIKENISSPNCGSKDEIISSLNRRLVLPLLYSSNLFTCLSIINKYKKDLLK